MKNPELMMYRVAIGQILADAGINRETIKEMVRESVDEKVERQVPSVIENKMAHFQNSYEYRNALRDAVRAEAEKAVKNLDIFINVPIENCTDNELIRECARRGMTVSCHNKS